MTHRTTKKKLLMGGVIALVAMLLPGCTASAPSPTPAKSDDAVAAAPVPFPVAFAFLKNNTYAGNYIADDSGLYAKAGLAPTFLGGGPNAPAPEVSISSGEAVLAFESNSSRLFSYLAKADDIVIIGQRFQTVPNGLLSLAKHPVRKASDLHGVKVIAGAANRTSMDALMAINNIKDYEFVPGGADVGPLLAGQGDALLAFATNQAITLKQQGMKENKDFYFVPFNKLNYYLMSEVVIVSKSYLASHRDEVVNFMAATVQGWQAQIKNPAKGAKLAVDKYGAELGLDLAQQIAAAKAEIPYMTSELTKKKGLFSVDPAYVEQYVYPSLEKAGITGMPAAADVIDTTVLDDVYKKISK